MNVPVAQQQQEEENLRNFNDDIKYIYFGRAEKNNNHKGVVCIGYKVDKTGTVLRMGVAFCSPEDVFAKEESRRRVLKRIANNAYEELVKDPSEISEDNPLFSNMRYEDVVKLIAISFNSSIPAEWNTSYKSYLNNSKEVYPTFARIKLPWWVATLAISA